MAKKKVYVAGPYTNGGKGNNTWMAISAGNAIAKHGMVPFIPHLAHFWNKQCPNDDQFWIDYDNEWLPVCDAVFRLSGESSGSDAEEKLAKSLGIPVFHDLLSLIEWSK